MSEQRQPSPQEQAGEDCYKRELRYRNHLGGFTWKPIGAIRACVKS
jgi:hypothetical protein